MMEFAEAWVMFIVSAGSNQLFILQFEILMESAPYVVEKDSCG
jgi:hypothetical protein